MDKGNQVAAVVTPAGPATSALAQPVAKDVTGMDRLAWNVITSWGGHLVFVVAGFVMPRMIDRHVGQTALGVWDFSWSVVSYFGLASLGIGSAVNRHVALYRAAHDTERMRRSVSSVVAVQLAIGLIVLIATAVVATFLPHIVGDRIGNEVDQARWIVALLGASLAFTMGFDSFRGIMTGCHRWDLHNGLNAGSYALTVTGMMILLWMGFGLRAIAALYLVLTALAEFVRVILAHRVCPELQIRPQYVTREEMRHMFVFGGNNFLAGLTPLLVAQTTNILIAGHLGAAALALFSRPIGLVRSVQTFLNKFAFVLTPTAGSLQGSGRTADIKRLVLNSTKASVALSLPMISMLIIQGDIILRLWMGHQYEQGYVLAVLALGAFLPMAQQPVMTILIGLNLHGKISVASLVIACIGVGIGIVCANYYGWTLHRAALMTAIPLTVANGIAVGYYACKRLEIPISEVLSKSFAVPFLCLIPIAAVQLAARVIFEQTPLLALLLGGGATALVAAPLYYAFVAPQQVKEKVRTLVRKAATFLRGDSGETGTNFGD